MGRTSATVPAHASPHRTGGSATPRLSVGSRTSNGFRALVLEDAEREGFILLRFTRADRGCFSLLPRPPVEAFSKRLCSTALDLSRPSGLRHDSSVGRFWRAGAGDETAVGAHACRRNGRCVGGRTVWEVAYQHVDRKRVKQRKCIAEITTACGTVWRRRRINR